MIQDYEKLGVFYLGRPYDLPARQAKPGLLLYDSKDLVTHAVCVGMTGSGKTGLCVSLIEEAAIDSIPALVIDPKGDLSNLLLTFPDLRPADFLPWINPEEARAKGVSPEEFASGQAGLWKQGLEQWGQDGGRIRRLRESAEFAIYTPGSTAGLPLSVLKSFAAPPPQIAEDRELMRERISATATALLGLLGIQADPIQSREHILLATLLDRSWREGQDLDLGQMIRQIQTPPVSRLGVMDLETFYPAQERFALALALNNLLASPGFEAWMEGEALDVGRLLYTSAGKPRVSIFSIAHLSEAERMFFVSLLLGQVVSWMRTQAGTTSLRAILYMDEIFGYFPPVANPPSKLPLLTLLKQARAYGLGVVLATQNPVDLDYKGLSNTGTWFIGRLQTERDKARVLDGLEGAAAGAGAGFDRARMEQILAGLRNRVFLLNNVHEDAPEIFETRWALSYLRGPLTRAGITMLMQGRKEEPQPAAAPSAAPRTAAAPAVGAGEAGPRPVLPPEVPQHFLPLRGAGSGQSLLYRPALLGAAQVRFFDPKLRLDQSRDVLFVTPLRDDVAPVRWEEAEAADLDLSDLEAEPRESACFAPLPAPALKPRSYAAWSKDFQNWLYASQQVEIFRSPSLGAVSAPGESERDFRIRIGQQARVERDSVTEKLRQKYAPRLAALEERIRRARQAQQREIEQAQDQKLSAAMSVGVGLLGALLGRKVASVGNLSRAGTAVRSMSRARRESLDVNRAAETVQALEQQLADLNAQFEAEAAALGGKLDPLTESLETVIVRPKKTNILVRLVALVWTPGQGSAQAAW